MVTIPEFVNISEPCAESSIKSHETSAMSHFISHIPTSSGGGVSRAPLTHEMPALVLDTEDKSTDDHTTDDDDERRPHNGSVAAVRRDMKREERLGRNREVIVEEETVNLGNPSLINDDETFISSVKSMKDGVFGANRQLSVSKSADTVVSGSKSVISSTNGSSNGKLSAAEFKTQRTQLMTIVVKYLATKIKNSFPPEATAPSKSTSGAPELALDRFILILTSRLRLPFNVFVHGMIYLFRYMDIVYLLRYLNQLNNNANCNMQFLVQKLIVGCFRLALCQTHRLPNIDWQKATGLGAREIDSVVLVLTMRMNGKLTVKMVEIQKLKQEILRFVKMVASVK